MAGCRSNLQGDLQEVTERGVSHVMRCFCGSLYDDTRVGEMLPVATSTCPDLDALLNGECEEMFNDFRRPGPQQR